MMNLLNYGMYLDSKEGATLEELCQDYGLSSHEVERRLAAATLCFEKQVRRVEFVGYRPAPMRETNHHDQEA